MPRRGGPTGRPVGDTRPRPPGGQVGPGDRLAVAGMSDAGLTTGVARGYPEALAEAYERYGACVHDLARRLCGSQQAAALTRQVFLALWDSPTDFDPSESSLRAQLLARTHAWGVALQGGDTARRAREAAMTMEELEADLVGSRIGEPVPQWWSDLPDGERQAITLAYFGGYTYRRIAAVVHRPEAMVKADIDAGLRRLRADRSE
jgi:RNA polymerase sigma-70 factor (ECF subfamily)